MNTDLRRAITDAEVEAYDRDGVVVLRDMFDADWIELLQQGMETHRSKPTDRARIWDRDEQGRTMFWDSQAWQRIDEYQQFVFTSPCGELAARIMRSTRVNFYFDAVFVRAPGSQFSTPWHQDEPYWSVEGYNTCTIWMPLVPVKKENALAFVPRSHRSDTVLH